MSITRQRQLDYMELEWGTYVERFNRLPKEEQNQRVKEMGFESFRDMLAHIPAWWEEGMGIILAIAEERQFERRKYDVDVFNAELMEKYSTWSDEDLFKHFETVRLALIDLVAGLPEDAFLNKDIESWLATDVVGHYDEHAVPV